MKNNIIIKNEEKEIKIDTKIIPLFSNPIYLKERDLKKKNKDNLLNPSFSSALPTNGLSVENDEEIIGENKLTSKTISFKENFTLFLKGFNKYNFNLNNYLLQHKKLDVIEQLIINSPSVPTKASLPALINEEENKKEKNINPKVNSNAVPAINVEEVKNSALANPITIFYNSPALQINHTTNQKENLKIESKPIINQYLKEMSIYNMKRKGLFIQYSKFIGFNFNKENNKLYKDLYKFISSTFKSMYCLISKPVFIITPDKIIIQLFYYLFIPNILKLKKFYKYKSSFYSALGKKEWYNRKKKIKKQYSKFRKIKLNVRIKLRNLSNITLTKIFSNKFRILCLNLNKIFNKPVELDLIRLHYPYNDSNILVNLLGIMINKIKFRIILRRLFEKAVIKNLNKLNGHKLNIIPAFLSGITIRVAGRLLTHKVVPRQTVKITRRGALAKGKINFKDIATYTNKNKRGAFSITVKSGQNFF